MGKVYFVVVVVVAVSASGEGRLSAGVSWMTFEVGSSVSVMTPSWYDDFSAVIIHVGSPSS